MNLSPQTKKRLRQHASGILITTGIILLYSDRGIGGLFLGVGINILIKPFLLSLKN
jgi:hypothetical protein